MTIETESIPLTEELMKEVDASGVEDPGSRAKKIFLILSANKEITNWDVLCFSIEYIKMETLSNPILTTAANVLTKWLYICHYVNKGFRDLTTLTPKTP